MPFLKEYKQLTLRCYLNIHLMKLKNLEETYKEELLKHIVPFWLEKSQDNEFGGYFTCLDRKGEVYDTDKFVWLQAREVWMFSTLFNNVEK